MYRILLCDDDFRIVKQMTNFFQMNSVKIQFEAVATGEELFRKLKEGNVYDIFVLGNMLKKLNGIEIARRLKQNGIQTKVLLLSGVEGFYDDAFEVGIFRYIKKPIDWIQFRKGIQKALEEIKKSNSFFYYKKEASIWRMPISNIIYIESRRRLVNIVTTTGIYSFYGRLDEVERQIREKNSYFLRIHKSYLVNIEHVVQYDYTKFYLADEQSLPISETKRSEIREEYLSYIDGM